MEDIAEVRVSIPWTTGAPPPPDETEEADEDVTEADMVRAADEMVQSFKAKNDKSKSEKTEILFMI